MKSKIITGKNGEELACKYLKQKHYKILERNYRCKTGELDIIAKYKKELVFVEVKTRRNLEYGYPIEAVNKIKQKHLVSAINYYIYLNKIKNIDIRVDVIEVYLSQNKIYINHIQNCNL